MPVRDPQAPPAPDAPVPPLPPPLQAVERALADLRRGAMVVLSAPGEALLLAAAEGTGHETLTRLRALAGAGALVLTARRAQLLGLLPTDADAHDGALRMALAAGVDTATVRQMADPTAPRPATMPPALALEPIAPGTAAAGAVELTKLARLLPAVVIAAVPGERRRYLPAWAEAENLLTVELADVQAYAERETRSLRLVADAHVPLTDAEDVHMYAFRPPDGGREHLAIVVGAPDAAEPVLTRVHSECFTGDLLGSLRCDCGEQLRGAIAEMRAAGSGVLLYLAQEGRGIGLVNKLRAYTLQDAGFDTVDANEQLGFNADERSYLPAAEMLRRLGFGRVRLMTNNPDKVAALADWGVEVVDRVPHAFPSNRHNEAYLATKQRRSGHLL